MHILQVVIKNTSTMDFTVPVLVELKSRTPEIRITVLYCVLDRRNILRNSKFYETLFAKHDILQTDFLDFPHPIWRPFTGVFRRLFSGSSADKIHFHEAYAFYCLNFGSKSRIGFISYLMREYGFLGLVRNLAQSIATWVERRYSNTFVNTAAILNELAPDIVLFDNRSVTQFQGRDHFYAWMYEHRVKVALLPHAPHLRDPVSEFCAFDEKGESLPDFCEFWVPLKFGEPWRQVPDRREQFRVTGYPGMDSAWLKRCRFANGEDNSTIKSSKKIRCLFVMRRYMPEGAVRPRALDPYIVDYQDVFGPLSALAQSLKELGQDVELVLKPHPANNYSVLAADMLHSGFSDWRISNESIYPLLSEVDIVVGLFSTVLLVPAMAGIPTVLIRTELQNVVHSEWPLLEEMYTGMEYYVSDLKELTVIIRSALEKLESGVDSEDAVRLRYYFPDRAVGEVVSCLF